LDITVWKAFDGVDIEELKSLVTDFGNMVERDYPGLLVRLTTLLVFTRNPHFVYFADPNLQV